MLRVKLRHVGWMLITSLFISLAGCSSKSEELLQIPDTPPNIAVFAARPDAVWTALMKVIRFDFLMPLEIVDRQRSYFSTELIRDSQPGRKSKYRVSGTVQVNQDGVIVTLYKQQQLFQHDRWVGVGSNYSLEQQILNRVRERLGPVEN